MRTKTLLFGGFAVLVIAMEPDMPKPTDNLAFEMALGMSPRPTDAPLVNGEFLRRQATSKSVIGFLGPDSTCGYENGLSASSKTCNGLAAKCAGLVYSGVATMGCCSSVGTTVSCDFFGKCFNAAQVSSSSLCGASCLSDSDIVKCTAAAAPYCVSFSVPGMSIPMAWFSCDSTTGTSYTPFPSTYVGQVSVHTWSPVYAGTSSSVLPNVGSQSGGGGGLSIAVSSGQSSSSSTITPTAQPVTSKISAGVIAGGVVGGLAILGATIFGIVFLCCFRKRGNNNINNAPPPQYPQQEFQQSYIPQQQGVPQQGFLNPVSPSTNNEYTNRQSVVSSMTSSPNTPQSYPQQVKMNPVNSQTPSDYWAPMYGIPSPGGFQPNPPPQNPMPAEMGGNPIYTAYNPAIPTHNPQGRPVYEAQ